MKRRNYSFWLILTYVVMAALCAALIIFMKEDMTSIIVNVAMFVIVLIIFIFAISKFALADRIQKELKKAAEKIREDASLDDKYLWDQYKDGGEASIFSKGILAEPFRKYVSEMNRMAQFDNAGYSCDIEDFINKDYIDNLLKRNILNLVPGTMTGLGILGTFVGLSFGLQYFNTGTAAEITDSIAPLMEGIKVAFHTSVYGMVFSLVFNFVYKNTMEAVYTNLEEFLNIYKANVIGDSINDNESKVRELIQAMPETIGTTLSEQIGQTLAPVVYNMNKTMMEFAQTVMDNQAEGMKGLVKEFVEQMHGSMEESYRRLGQVMNETSEIQKQTNAYSQTIMERLGAISSDIVDINNLSNSVISHMAGYVAKIDELQGVINSNYTAALSQMNSLGKHEEEIRGYMSALTKSEREINSGLSTAASELSIAAVGLNDQLTASLNKTLSMFDSNLAEITNYLSQTVSEIESATNAVPQTVKAACDDMRRSFDQMNSELRRG